MQILVVILLIASAINLALMIPGGLVENRDFSAYSSITLAAFNIFLTVLGLGSFVLAYLVYTHGGGDGLAALAGLGYMAVYVADLKHIFPVSPTAMSPLLTRLEWLGTWLGLGLTMAGLWAWHQDASRGAATMSSLPFGTLLIMALAGIGIIIFATVAAAKKK